MFTLLFNFLIQFEIVWYNHNLSCLLIQVTKWCIHCMSRCLYISPIASKHLLNQYYNSQPKTHGTNYILAYTRLLSSLVQRQENYDLAKIRISIGLISRHMRPDYGLQ